jgi:chitodextrinase
MRGDASAPSRTSARRGRRSARSRRLRVTSLFVLVLVVVGALIRQKLAVGNAAPAADVTIASTTPAGLTASNVTAHSVTLTWSASTGKLRDYLVFRDGAAIGTATLTTFTDSTVAARTSYSYQIRAHDKAGHVSAPTAAFSVTTPRGRAVAPTVPTGLTAKAVSPTRVELSWRPATRRASFVRYSVYRNGRKIGASKINSFQDANARPATAYSYRISAGDAVGRVSRRSKAAKVTTPAVAGQPSSSPTGTSGPSAFPGATNTGYENAPGYPGSLKDCDRIVIRSDSTYQYCNFSDGLSVGSANKHLTNVRFVGCRFASNAVDDANVADYGDGIVFSYDTFEPNAVPASSEPTSPHAEAIANGQGYQYGIDQRYSGALTVDHSDFWGFAEAIQFGYSSQAKPLIVSNTWIHNPRNPGRVDHSDGILENYGGLSYMVFNHNTIVGDGNTNALALQGGVGYSHVTITNNYFSGYGYMVNSGADSKSTYMVFTGNVWGTDFEPYWGPLYGDAMYTTPGLDGVWRDNTIHVQLGGTWMSERNNGMYWWPTDGNPSNSSQIVGHKTDYRGP